MKRLYELVIDKHFKSNRQMLFLMGPRQVGKTTLAKMIKKGRHYLYLNWDVLDDRKLILKGPKAVAESADLAIAKSHKPFVIFDEIHKYRQWKTFLKGFYDKYGTLCKILVTGSARLDVYQKGGDSLMGRYFAYRIHPFSIAELTAPTIGRIPIRRIPKKISEASFNKLWICGGYPEPYQKGSKTFLRRWQRDRFSNFFRQDIRELTDVSNLDSIEHLAMLIEQCSGQLISYETLAKEVLVTGKTIKSWIQILKRIYYCFEVKPYFRNVARSLRKEPKYYLCDWTRCPNEDGPRAENFVACHLNKAVHFWNDHGFGTYQLHFIRDRNKREVDFLVTEDHKPWMLIEVKHSKERSMSPHLVHFHKVLKTKHAFQVVLDMPFEKMDCFKRFDPVIVPARTLLAQLI